MLVYHRSLRERVAGARDRMPRLRHVVELDDDHGDSDYEELLRSHAPAPRIERSGDDLLLWYTGGTTGLPKGVLWHQGTLLGYGLIAAYALQGEAPPDSVDQLIADVQRWRDRGTPLVSLLTTPLVHATAVHQANTAFAVGGTIVLLERGHTDGDTICATIERERPNVLEIVGDVLMRRIAHALDAADARGEPYDLSSLRRIHNSGAMVSAPLKDALLSRGTMHVYDSLGSSEAVGFGVALDDGPGPERDRALHARPERRACSPTATATSPRARARSACSRSTPRARSATTRIPGAARSPSARSTARRPRHAGRLRRRSKPTARSCSSGAAPTASTRAARRSGPRRSRRCSRSTRACTTRW